MVDYLRRPVSHEAFFKKYASKKFLKGRSSHGVLFAACAYCVHSVDHNTSMGKEVPLDIPWRRQRPRSERNPGCRSSIKEPIVNVPLELLSHRYRRNPSSAIAQGKPAKASRMLEACDLASKLRSAGP